MKSYCDASWKDPDAECGSSKYTKTEDLILADMLIVTCN